MTNIELRLRIVELMPNSSEENWNKAYSWITKEVTKGFMPVPESEKQSIIAAVQLAKGNRKQASAIAGISERTLYRKMKEYGLA